MENIICHFQVYHINNDFQHASLFMMTIIQNKKINLTDDLPHTPEECTGFSTFVSEPSQSPFSEGNSSSRFSDFLPLTSPSDVLPSLSLSDFDGDFPSLSPDG